MNKNKSLIVFERRRTEVYKTLRNNYFKLEDWKKSVR